jgi:fructoselysine-6-P-deglycase FrlB-like protein
MTPADLVASLKTVPEAHLRIIGLVWELTAPNGALDELKAVLRMGEIRDACQEAEDYAAATKKLAEHLRECLRDRW